jgi:hypothetical protein
MGAKLNGLIVLFNLKILRNLDFILEADNMVLIWFIHINNSTLIWYASFLARPYLIY